MLNRKPSLVTYDTLQPGDIIIIRAPQGLAWYEKIPFSFYYFYQSIVSQEHGHYDNTHAAICTANNNGLVRIAHVVNTGYETFTANEFSLPGPFWVYRPKNTWIAAQIAEIAKPNDENKKLQWSGWEAMKTLITRAKNKDDLVSAQKYVSETTICSKFVLQVMQEAASTAYPDLEETTILQDFAGVDPRQQYFPTVSANSLPKTLEAYLYASDHYEFLVYPGEQPYVVLNRQIAIELKRISLRDDFYSRKKFNEACDEYKAVHQVIAADEEATELDKTFFLVSSMLPKLAIKTRYSLGETSSVSNVLAAAREIGLFRRDFVVLQDEQDEEKEQSLDQSISLP